MFSKNVKNNKCAPKFVLLDKKNQKDSDDL